MALHKESSFGVTEGIDFGINEIKNNVKEEQEAQEVQEVHGKVKPVSHTECRKLGSTQGKKGQKLKRINMAFDDINYDYVTRESRRQGMSATAFVNMIIEQYRLNR